MTLLFDYASGERVEVLPDVERSGIEAVEWFAGNWPLLPAGGLGSLPSISPYEGVAFEHGVERWAEEPETARLRALRNFEAEMERYHGAVAFLDKIKRDSEDVEAGRSPTYGALYPRSATRNSSDYSDEVEMAEQRVEMRLRSARLALNAVAAFDATPPAMDAGIRETTMEQGPLDDRLVDQMDALRQRVYGSKDGDNE